MMSGWSTFNMAMLAPRRVPPCLTCSVAVLNIFINETGPEATPPVVPTMLFLGRRREKRKAGAAAGFVNQGGISQGTENSLHAVFNRQNETGRQLTQSASGIHQGRGVGQKFKLGHDLVKDFLNFFDALFIATVFFFGFGDMAGHPSEHLLRRFGDFTVAVLFKVSPSQNPSGIVGEIHPIFNKIDWSSRIGESLVKPYSINLASIIFSIKGMVMV